MHVVHHLLSIKTTRSAMHEFQFKADASLCVRTERDEGFWTDCRAAASCIVFVLLLIGPFGGRASLGGSCALVSRISHFVMVEVLDDLMSVHPPLPVRRSVRRSPRYVGILGSCWPIRCLSLIRTHTNPPTLPAGCVLVVESGCEVHRGSGQADYFFKD